MTDEIKNPASSFETEMQGLDKTTGEIIASNNPGPKFLRVGGHVWQEAPAGDYVAKCTKVDHEFRFKNNRKLALYFTIMEGEHAGKRARLFYNKMDAALAEQAGTDFGPHSKFCKDIKRLYPDKIGDGSSPVEIDPVGLFHGEIFQITVTTTGKAKQATVTHIDHWIGW